MLHVVYRSLVKTHILAKKSKNLYVKVKVRKHVPRFQPDKNKLCQTENLPIRI